MITILGPTACGKTHLAVLIANKIDAEIISADSRQVYRRMDIGTGKDLNEYEIGGKSIPYHLINIAEPGYAFNVYEYVNAFEKAYKEISRRNKKVVLCGGSGMYIEAVLKGYTLEKAPFNEQLREKLNSKSQSELVEILNTLKRLHNTTDITDRERLLRAIEIETFNKENNIEELKNNVYKSLIIGVNYPREIIRNNITQRLNQRLENGMIEEVESLLSNGLSPETLKYYGLEYKFITQYICREINYDDMKNLLNTAIHQFAKRQMTWFRRMEKQGFLIHWVDGSLSDEEKVDFIINAYSKEIF